VENGGIAESHFQRLSSFKSARLYGGIKDMDLLEEKIMKRNQLPDDINKRMEGTGAVYLDADKPASGAPATETCPDFLVRDIIANYLIFCCESTPEAMTDATEWEAAEIEGANCKALFMEVDGRLTDLEGSEVILPKAE
jgi:hypothetical protein